MTSTIKQDLNQTYLILDEPVPCQEDYRFHMLLSNHIRGLADCSVRSMDNHVRFYYDISGKRMLLEELQQYKVTAVLLKNLMTEILELEREMQEYLLELSCVILDPEYIYLDKNGFSFVYLPTRSVDTGEAFHQLTGILLEYLDYDDEEATELLYALHSRTRGTYHLRKLILDLTEQGIGCSRESRAAVQPEPMVAFRDQEDDTKPSQNAGILKHRKDARKKERKKSPGLKDRLFKKERKERWEDPWGTPGPSWIESAVFEEDPATTYLEYQPEGKGISLNAEDGLDRLLVKETPFLIGSAPDEVNGYIANPTISRVHASIDLVAGFFFLQDENSRNGTFYNGRKLDMGERVKLSPGDKIMFANVEYKVTPVR